MRESVLGLEVFLMEQLLFWLLNYSLHGVHGKLAAKKKTKKIAHFLLLSKFHMNCVQMGNKIKTEITAYKKCMNPQLLPTVFERTPGTAHYQKEDHLLAD